MHFLKTISLYLSILFIIGCSEKAIERDCIDEKMDEYELTPYKGETLNSCDFRMELYILDNKQFSMFISPVLII